MSSNSFGNLFRITTFGESHGAAIGVVIDGCPAGLLLTEDDINAALHLRKPGNGEFVSPRQEPDQARILSGLFEGKTTGAPIAIVIDNKDADSSQYDAVKDLLRPGHATFPYLEKYGVFDYRGGGRASARETVCRVAAGVVAMKLLAKYNIQIAAFVKSIGDIDAVVDYDDVMQLRNTVYESSIFCPDENTSKKMMDAIHTIKKDKDSLGGVIEFVIANAPVGLGEPLYQKLNAMLANAMMSIPAAKGFELGEGFHAARMKGSEHNDSFVMRNGKVETATNYAGGILAGISTGMPIVGRVAFKPTSSILQSQPTLDINGNAKTFQLPDNARHDPCVAIRAVPVVEAMCALVIADAILLNRVSKVGD